MPAAAPAPPAHATPATVRTTCCYCGVGCGIVVRRDAQGDLHLDGDPDHPSSQGMLCSKGRTLLHTVRATANRLLWPQVRHAKGAPLRRTSWDDAIATVAKIFRRIQAEHGRDAVGLYVSGQCLTEEYYAANKLAKGFLGTNNIDTNSRLCMSSAVAGYKKSLGSDSVPASYADLDLADTFLISGANPAWCHPIIFRRIERRKQADPDRVRLICIDPRRTATAEASDLHLPIRPGSDVILHLALAQQLIATGAVDQAWIAAHANGWNELREAASRWPLATAAEACGVPAADIATAASWLAGDRRFLSLWAMGLNQSAVGVDKNTTLINLSLITGKIGTPGNGPFSLTGQPNAMGGREVGGLANLLPAHRDLADPAHRSVVEEAWGIAPGTIQAKPGLTAMEMLDALESGRLKALWVMCTNPAVSWPDGERAAKALAKAELLVVQDCFATETTALADVVLPAATWLEKTGTMTNSERRIALVEQLVAAPGEALPDWRIIQRVATAMGWGADFAWKDEEAVYREHAALTTGTDCDVTGVSYARLRSERSLQWPVPDAAHPGTPRLFASGRFPTPDGKARLQSPAIENRSELPDADYPLVLTTGRVRDQWHTMTRSGTVAKLRAHEPVPRLDIHPGDAAAHGIADGTPVEVASRRGACTALARLDPGIRQGTVFLPMHWGRGVAGGHANAVTSPRFDPVSKEPDLKFCAVRIRDASPPPRRIVIVGAGAAALAFVEDMRRSGRSDAITILGDEPEPIYDRVLLPHLIDGHKSWADLVRATPEQMRVRDVDLRGGDRVAAIDRHGKTVVTAAGARVPYDTLILATGSRANRPDSGPLAKPGTIGLRSRRDAEAISAAAQPGRRIVIQGGGVLGLELAASLHQRGAQVAVIQRSSRLMGRSIDQRASVHLAAHLRERGIAIHLDANLDTLEGADRVTGVRLDNGTVLPCDLFVFAIGTVPNSELARAAGIACGKGVTVDAHLRTSDPDIHAIGECAEFQGQGYGTSAAAGEQAAALAQWLRGNPHAPYRGAPVANILKVPGVPLAACGLVDADHDPSYEQVVYEDARRRTYLKAVIKDDRLVGVLMLGNINGFARLRALIAEGTELEEQRANLFLGTGSAAVPRGKLVCSCNQVGEDQIAEAAKTAGCDAQAVMRATAAGTACGSCRPEVAGICARLRSTVAIK